MYARHVSPSYPAFLERLGLASPGVRAEAAVVTDADGRQYIDCTAGYGLLNFGHHHPRLVAALKEQLEAHEPLSRPLITAVQARLAERLAEALPGDLQWAFLCNSGSEAVDTAMKLARLVTGRKGLIATSGAFHGYTFGALSASGLQRWRRPFEPLVPRITHVPFGDAQALAAAIGADTAAVLLEPVQHEAGVIVPPAGYLAAARAACDRHGALLIVDEVKTGLGRIGHLVACAAEAVVPDVLVLGKSLGGGLVPTGAVVARAHLWRRFALSFAMAASSYAGNALACRVALASLELARDAALLDSVRAKGARILARLGELVAAHPELLVDVAGRGLLISLRLKTAAAATALVQELVRRGVLVMPAFGDAAAVMIEPPLVIGADQVECVLETFASALDGMQTRCGG